MSQIYPVTMIDVQGTTLTEEDKSLLEHPAVGGLIFFARNYESPQQLKALVQSIRAIRPDILLAVDQEGGRVQRFREGFVSLPPMGALGRHYAQAPEAALRGATLVGQLMASELIDMGIDISFAPVLDVDDNKCSAIAQRSFSPDPEAVVQLANAFIDGMALAGMASTGKHFPGHGSVTVDSHLEQPVDPRAFAEIEAHDLVPFKALMPRLSGIIPAHIVYSAVDENTAGFSPHWLQQVLRGQLGFDGVIFSDDLGMEGAASAGGFAQRAEAALRAGCDMVLPCNQRLGQIEVIEWLEKHPHQPLRSASLLRAREQAVVMSQQRRSQALAYLETLQAYWEP